MDQLDARTVNCILAVVQALMRPLREQETHNSLARRACLMIASKPGVNLPPNLDMTLNKMAAVANSEGAKSVVGSPAGKSQGSEPPIASKPAGAAV